MTDDPRIDPADLRSAKFPGSFRKYDAGAVMAFLESVADRVEATNALVDDLQRQLEGAKLVKKVAPEPARVETTSPFDAPDLSTLSDDDVMRLLGEETASVLSTARKASEEIRTKAETNAERLIRESTAEAQRVVEEAEARAVTLTTEAAAVHDEAVRAANESARKIVDDAAEEAEHRTMAAAEATTAERARAEQIRADADDAASRAKDDADALLEQERERADQIRADAEVQAAEILERAREEGRSMVQEAKEVRTRVLDDLVRRREVGRTQIERLLEGRDRLIEAYAKVRENADQMADELATVLDVPEPDPVLEAGFVGIVTSAAADVEDAGATETSVVADAPTADVTPADGPDVPGDEVSASPETQDDVVAAATETATGDDDRDLDVAGPTDSGPIDSGPIDSGPTGPDGDVDALFARIKSQRAESVARAQHVLGEAEDADAGPATDAVVEPEPVAAGEDPVDESAGADETTEPEETTGNSEEDPTPGEDDPTPGEDDPTPGEDDPTPGEDDPAPGEEDPASGETDVDRVPVELLASGPVHDHRSATVAELDKALSRALKRHLAHEQNEVLDALRTTESTDVTALLPPESDHIAGYALVAVGPLSDAAAAGAGLIDDTAEIDVSDLAEAMAGNLISTFRRRIERSASEVGDDADALDERLRALYREWKVERIGVATTDSLLSAYAEGQLAAAPEGSMVRWLIDPDQGPCPDAQDNALAGAIVAGEGFPTGDACPQAHPGCRCLLAIDS